MAYFHEAEEQYAIVPKLEGAYSFDLKYVTENHLKITLHWGCTFLYKL